MAIENLKQLEATLKLPEGTLQRAIESTEAISVELPELEIFTKDEYTNKINVFKKTFQDQGVDFAVQAFKDKEGLQFEGRKLDKLIDAVTSKKIEDMKIEPEKQVSEMSNQILNFKKILEEKDNEMLNLKLSYKKKDDDQTITTALKNAVKTETIIPIEDLITIFEKRAKIEFQEGKMIAKKDNEVIKDKYGIEPLNAIDIFTDFAQQYLKPILGAGGKDEVSTLKKGTFESFNEEMQKAGITGEAYNEEMQRRIQSKQLSF
jgi:succinate dehydrogenase flavin-adding protein (antitoxin of CptAB toxin-antitoxin module)